MYKKLFISIIALYPLFLTAQLTDDFSDEDFTQNPEWVGDITKFIIENQVLRLNDQEAGQAYLATHNALIQNTQWEFWLRLAFTPSSNNHPKIYLVSDSEDLSEALHGYYIRIGKDGTDNKRLYFYRQDGDSSVEIMEGAYNLANASDNRLRIKATRDGSGHWDFWADPTGGNVFIHQGSANDSLHSQTQWFGVQCNYTVSNARNFYFDEFYVGKIIQDTIPPEIIQILPTGPNTLEITFSEALESESSQKTTNFFVDQGIGAPEQAIRPDSSPHTVILSFAESFVEGKEYILSVANIRDLAWNTMADFTGKFAWYIPKRYDVVFNEIMANPSPAVGLPPHEYIELFNTSAYDINLQGWTLQHGTAQREIPHGILPARGYIVLTNPTAWDDMNSLADAIAIPGLPINALPHSGTSLVLYDNVMEIISHVTYSDQWYDDPEKVTGGWALEKIDPDNYCAEKDNWIASKHPDGGTPGKENSVIGENPDTTPPALTHVSYHNTMEISLFFSESMDEPSLINPAYYSINHGIGHPLAVSAYEPDFKGVRLMLPVPLEPNQAYEMTLTDDITDCAGNSPGVNTMPFANYTAQRYDVVFNELMANPAPVVGLPPHKYLELYNTSDFPIDLSGWIVTHGTTQRELPRSHIPAKGFAVITTESAGDDLSHFNNVIAVPGLSNNFLTLGGLTLTLANPQGELMATVSYSDSWYANASKSNGGWSIEKIDPYNFCATANNWTASTDESGGTPGRVNSVRAENPDTKAPLLLRAGYEESTIVSLFFDEPMEEATLLNPQFYSIDNGMGHPVKVDAIAPDFSKVMLFLAQKMEEGVIYEIEVSQNITDCASNALHNNTARVAVPKIADSLDLVINEVLFNPPDKGERFIEIYNRSSKIIDLQKLTISSKDTVDNVFTTVRPISQESHLIFPQEYRVLTPDPAVVKGQYMTYNPLGFIQVAMPTMTNTHGILVLANKSQRIIDQLIYHEDMHYALLTTRKGVSLERLNYNRPTQDKSNWHSAAQHVGFATPAYKNSQFTYDPDGQKEVFEVYPLIFSPDNTGQDDVLNIAYSFDSPGYTANIHVYDSRGRLVRVLSRGELLATQGVITWDGTTSQNLKADIGIYLILMEVFDPEGKVRTYRKTAVLAGRLQ